MNFNQFFELIQIRFSWSKDEGYWICSGCKVPFDKPARKLHSSINCSFSKLPIHNKLRANIIESNPKLYKKYCQAKGIKISDTPILDEDRPVPISWYHKQIRNFRKLTFPV